MALTHSGNTLLIFPSANQKLIQIDYEVLHGEAVALSENAEYVAVTENNKLKIWHLDWEGCQAHPTGLTSKHQSIPTDVCFSPDSKTLATSYASGCILLLDLVEQKEYTVKICNEYISSVMWSPATDFPACITDSGVRVRRVQEVSECYTSLSWQAKQVVCLEQQHS